MKLFSMVVALAVSWVLPLGACDFCAVYSAQQAHGELGKGFFAGLTEQFTRMGTLQLEGQKVPNEVGQYLDSSISQALAGYNFSERIGLQFNLPVIYRAFKRPEGFGIQRGTVFGIGDVVLLGHGQLYRRDTEPWTISWAALGGVKFPTGSTSRLKEELEEVPSVPPSGIHGHDLTLGSGSFDGILGTGAFTRWRRSFVTAAVQYAIRSEGDFEYQFANDVAWWGGPGAYLLLKHNHTVALQLSVSGETKGRDTFQGAKVDDTGITSVFLGPKILWTWSDRLGVEVGVDIPVSIDNTGFQAVPDYRVRGALTWHF